MCPASRRIVTKGIGKLPKHALPPINHRPSRRDRESQTCSLRRALICAQFRWIRSRHRGGRLCSPPVEPWGI